MKCHMADFLFTSRPRTHVTGSQSHSGPEQTNSFLIDDHLYSAILCSLEQTHCACMWFYMSDWLFIAHFFEYSPKWCTYSAGMVGAT